MIKKDAEVNIMGLKLSGDDREAWQARLSASLAGAESLFIATPNPEIVLSSYDDEELNFALNRADLLIPDGIGLVFSALFQGKKLQRWPGSDISTWLLAEAQKKAYRVAIILRSDGLSSLEDIDQTLRKKYPVLSFSIFPIKLGGIPEKKLIRDFDPNIVLVALGSPFQEKIILKNRSDWGNPNIMIGIGGSLDYLTGKIKASPSIMKSLGLEWLWRLICLFSYANPVQRLKRIMTALFVFPISYLKWLWVNPFLYRPNVLCLLYKKIEQSFFVLLIKRSDLPDHWQIPQGGTDGLSIDKAGRKEIEEELGIKNFSICSSHKTFCKYDFSEASPGGRVYKNRNYRGQKQGLVIAEYQGEESIKLNEWEYEAWQWAPLDKVIEKVHPVRKEIMEKVLILFRDYIKNSR